MRNGAFVVVAASLLYIGGCAGLQPELPGDLSALPACPAEVTSGVGLSVSTLPLRLPSEVAGNVALDTLAPVSKRIVVTSTAHWYKLSVRTLGGTLEAWTRLEAGGALLEAASDVTSPDTTHAARGRIRVEAGKGGLTITRPAAEPDGAHATAIMADVVLLPGGVPVDESVLRIQQLWDAKGAALARPERTTPKMTMSRPMVAMTSLNQRAPLERVVVDHSTAGSENMRLAMTAPPTAPAI